MPDSANSQRHRRAVSALNRGDLRAMAGECEAIVAADPDFADAWFLLAIAAEARRDLPGALAQLERAVSLAPDNSDYLAQQAKLLALLNRPAAALAAADAALAAGEPRALALDTLGVVFTRLGEHARAARVLQRAVDAAPSNAQFHFNLASAQQFLGDESGARAHYERAIDLQPRFARAYWALSELEKTAPDTTRQARLEALAADPALGAVDRLYIGHALSRLYEQRGDYPAAFAALCEAKNAQRERIAYDRAQDEALFAALQQGFTAADPEPRPPQQDWTPLFIVGMPRSGTTLVERMLSAHPAIAGLGELQDFPHAVKAASGERSPRVLDPAVIAGALEADPEQIARTYRNALETRGGTPAPGTRYLADKQPLNVLQLGFILRALPAARVIIVRRDPLDTCLANYRQLFAVNFSYYNYAYDIADTAHYYCLFDRLCRHWHTLYGARIHALQYEQLVEDPRQTLGAALDYLALPWDDACLDFHHRDGAVTTASAMQVRQPLYRDAIGRWRKYEKEMAPAIAELREQGVTGV
ncbi:sulfotransferase family protein [Mangrovimicrobium sediminis]|uniref:Sulfotransferase family protein n=1 Tax=Mangrovimicrobium sediminis TaxID=2562682 RepID=A0A4Z0LYD3_9GAMM|nr:sulfotransferase [Haliea sp. SAOS-164]TGD72291.1 sulfotransferase family protein [Haliea sp. SAOS-164]